MRPIDLDMLQGSRRYFESERLTSDSERGAENTFSLITLYNFPKRGGGGELKLPKPLSPPSAGPGYLQ